MDVAGLETMSGKKAVTTEHVWQVYKRFLSGKQNEYYQYEIEFYTVECSGGSLYTVGSLLIQMGNPLRIATVVNRPVR